MKPAKILVLSLIVLGLSCSSPSNNLIGKWQSDTGMTIEFTNETEVIIPVQRAFFKSVSNADPSEPFYSKCIIIKNPRIAKVNPTPLEALSEFTRNNLNAPHGREGDKDVYHYLWRLYEENERNWLLLYPERYAQRTSFEFLEFEKCEIIALKSNVLQFKFQNELFSLSKEDKERDKESLPGGRSPEGLIENGVGSSNSGEEAINNYKKYKGAWFEIDIPDGFDIISSLKSASTNGYESVFFRAPDEQVEFYIFSPQWNGEASDIALGGNEKLISSEIKKVGTDIVTWYTIRANDGSYTRAYQDTKSTDGSIHWVIGIKYTNQAAYDHYKSQYLEFKKSLMQFSD